MSADENDASGWVRTAYLLTRDDDRALALVAAGMDTARRDEPGATPETVLQATVRT